MTRGAQWGGQPVKLEAEFLITRRLVPSLALAGATLADVVHAQAYLTQPEECAAFNEVWQRHFGPQGPALSIIPCIEHGLAPHDGTIEINTLAVKTNGATRKQPIDIGMPTAFRGQPQAVKAGDLLFMSGLMAIEHDGIIAPTRIDARQPHFSSGIEAQAECIVDNVARLCEAAGTSLANVVRVQQFHTDIGEFYPVYKVWERRLNGPVPYSAVEVPMLPVPGARVLMDVWAYAP
jgi:enamine deaminase RidA (YjgF/YER057c/UK114 family)